MTKTLPNLAGLPRLSLMQDRKESVRDALVRLSREAGIPPEELWRMPTVEWFRRVGEARQVA